MFSWDPRKALSNLKKHGVSFEEAESVFDDPWVLDWHDHEHSEDEQRRKCIGLSIAGKILVIAYAPRRSKDGSEIIRIISARRASRQEREAYP